MNRISLIGMIFGLILISLLSFVAGFITSHLMGPSEPLVSSGGAPSSPSIASTTGAPAPAAGAATSPPDAKGATPQQEAKAGETSDKPAASPDSKPGAETNLTAASNIEDTNVKTASQRIPTQADVGKFSLQIKTFGEYIWAVQTMKILKKLGYGCYIVKFPKNRSQGYGSMMYYDVRVGVFDNYVQANQFARHMRLLGHTSASVTAIQRNIEIVDPDK